MVLGFKGSLGLSRALGLWGLGLQGFGGLFGALP